MKTIKKTLLLALAILAGAQTQLQAQGTAFTYQGRLQVGAGPANGLYDMAFAVFATNVAGVALAGPTPMQTVPVSNGLFVASVDLGAGVFSGPDRWLEIYVRTNSSNPLDPFTTLAPRQKLAPTPYAIFANRAASADALNGTLPASQIGGTIAPANIAPGTITGGMLAPGAVSMLSAPDGSPTNAVQVDTNGLVGIGTGTPAAGLQITSGASIATLPVLFEVQNNQHGWTNISEVVSVAAKGNLVAVGGLTGVTIATLTNPAAPAVLSQVVRGTGGLTNFTYITTMAWCGSNLVASAWGAMSGDVRAVNILGCTNPASPVKLAELRNGLPGWNNVGYVTSLASSGNLLAMGGENTNYIDMVLLADLSNPSAPLLKGTITNGVAGFTNLYAIESLAFSGNLLAIGAENGVTLVDVSNPAIPVKLAELRNGVGGYTNWNSVGSVSISGNLMAVASFGTYTVGTSFVTLVDISNPASPVKLAEIRDGTGGFSIDGPRSVALAGNRLVISADYPGTVSLVDVSNPLTPLLLATDFSGQNGADYLGGPSLTFAGTNIVGCGFGAINAYGVTVLGLGMQSAGLLSSGWVGIGTSKPSAALDVVGDVLFENATLFDANAQRVALGYNALASGSYATAMGQNAAALGDNSVAIGAGANASGYAATALGEYSTAGGGGSTALGVATTASGDISTAMGFYSTAGGEFSTAIGYYANAAGSNSLALGNQAAAVHDNTFVWSDGTGAPFSSTINNEFSIGAQNGVHIQTDKGIHMNAANEPMVVRDWDIFAGNAPSYKAGIGRWGMFMEINTLVLGIPADDIPGRYFQVAKYSTNGTSTMLMQVDQAGSLTVRSSLTVSNNAQVMGLLRSGSETTSEAPFPAGLVVRRVNTTDVSAGQIVARTDLLTLERDSTYGGFLLRYPAFPGNVTIACMGINNAGANVNFFTALNNPSTAGTVQIYADAQNVVHFECSFGVTYSTGHHLTQVTLSRWGLDNYWSGTLMSTFNQ